ncbi:MAG: metallophosphoesterase [Deltaproteobacteria bacterium]|nr:metallophosphoesterase [Deltaproteobacteria bacterium]
MPLQAKPFCSALAHLCLLACTVALLLCCGPGCSEFTGGLSPLPTQSSLASFTTNARIRAEISPGKILCASHPLASALSEAPSTDELCASANDGATQDPFVAVLRASAPLPLLFLDNGDSAARQLRLRLTNARADLTTSVVLLPLRPGAPRTTACPEPGSTSTYLTPPPELRRSETEREWLLLLPACSSISLRFALPADRQDSFRLLIAGPNASSDNELDALIADANAWPADHIHFLGGMLNPNATEPAARLLSLVEPRISVPYSLSLGDAERAAGRDAYFERFGPSDFSSMLGNVRLLSLDTSNGELSLDQLDFVQNLEPAPAGLALLFHAPALPAAISPEGLVSSERSLRLLELLRDHGFGHLFSVADRADTSTVNNTQLIQLTDPTDDRRANYARVLITELRSATPCISVELRSVR